MTVSCELICYSKYLVDGFYQLNDPPPHCFSPVYHTVVRPPQIVVKIFILLFDVAEKSSGTDRRL